MILTNDEMERVRSCVEVQAGLDEELLRRCGHLMHLGAFDEAVRSAFVLLEERLREALDAEELTGTRLALKGFDPDNGALAKHVATNRSQRLGLQGLYTGAFRLFRNPSAHSVVGYSPADGKAIIGLVDLLLRILQRAEELPPPGAFPENVEALLKTGEEEIGPGGSTRLRSFLGKCLNLGLQPSKGAKVWIPFRQYAHVKFDWWEAAKPHRIALFYLGAHRVGFPTSGYYMGVTGFDVDQLVEELIELGFQPSGKKREPTIDLRNTNDQAFFGGLFDLVARTDQELEDSLQQE
jgi:uncharacterized protein (TIGR02391 family)